MVLNAPSFYDSVYHSPTFFQITESHPAKFYSCKYCARPVLLIYLNTVICENFSHKTSFLFNLHWRVLHKAKEIKLKIFYTLLLKGSKEQSVFYLSLHTLLKQPFSLALHLKTSSCNKKQVIFNYFYSRQIYPLRKIIYKSNKTWISMTQDNGIF